MTTLTSLDAPEALVGADVGWKVAALATARQRGFPVLPGLVVSAREGRLAIATGTRALAERGRAAARPAVNALPVDPELTAALAGAATLGPNLIVRSSTRLDNDGAWSGAFASYGDVAPVDLPVAVRGCWSSVFAPGALDRLAASGLAPEDVGMSALVQPAITPVCGGWAQVDAEVVRIGIVRGHPAPLLSGWVAGFTLEADAAGAIVAGGDRLADLPIGLAEVREVVSLALRARDELGANRLEWALDDRLVLLQVDRQPASTAEASFLVDSRFALPAVRRTASLVVDRRGILSARLLAPWCAAATLDTKPALAADLGAAAAWDLALTTVAALTRQVITALGRDASSVVEALLAADRDTLERLSGVTVKGADVAIVIGALERVGETLTADGRLRASAELWLQAPDWVSAAVRGEPTPTRADRPVDPWTDLLLGHAAVTGSERHGDAASDGRAVARAFRARSGRDARMFPAGGVLVLRDPVQAFAPLLWRASALVTTAGAPAAHLLEVARSLHVPAVVSVELDGVRTGDLLAVDGTSGRVWAPTRQASSISEGTPAVSPGRPGRARGSPA